MNWTPQEKVRLVALVKDGKSWSDIAEQMPGRTLQACQSKACYLRSQGTKIGSPVRVSEKSRGRGRPKNKHASDKLWFRLDREIKQAFAQLSKDLGVRPSKLLQAGLERLAAKVKTPVARPAKYTHPHEVTEAGDRVPICWGVPSKLLAEAMKHSKLQATETAELAVRKMLIAYGYRIVSKT